MYVERSNSAKSGMASLSRCHLDGETNAEKKPACELWVESFRQTRQEHVGPETRESLACSKAIFKPCRTGAREEGMMVGCGSGCVLGHIK